MDVVPLSNVCGNTRSANAVILSSGVQPNSAKTLELNSKVSAVIDRLLPRNKFTSAATNSRPFP